MQYLETESNVSLNDCSSIELKEKRYEISGRGEL